MNCEKSKSEEVAVSTLLKQLISGDQLALARAITTVENNESRSLSLLAAVQPYVGKAKVIGITGPPGAGKSTLVDVLVKEIRSRDKTVCVLAVDPSSPMTGGAILGDRIRMAESASDPGVFIRSLASRRHLGGLSRTTWSIVQLMDAAGPDFVIVETVGAGQSEVEVADFAHSVIVVCAPGLGDDIQAMKAGILEIADVLVVNKSDQPLARDTVVQLKGMLNLRDQSKARPSIISTTATTGDGIPLLFDTLEKLLSEPKQKDQGQNSFDNVRLFIAEVASLQLNHYIRNTNNIEVELLCHRVKSGEINIDEAARRLLVDNLPDFDLSAT